MRSKKGFTLVELLIVIAILAILATVSIIGYTSFIDKANQSVDEQAVTQINTALEGLEITDGKFTDVSQVIAALSEMDLDIEDYKPLKSKMYFYWVAGLNRVIYADEKDNIVYPEDIDASGKQWMSLSGIVPTDSNYDVVEGAVTIDSGAKLAHLIGTYKDTSTDLTITLSNDVDLKGAAVDFGLTNANVTIDGNGHTLSGLRANDNTVSPTTGEFAGHAYGYGLFGKVSGNGKTVTIENVTISGLNVGNVDGTHDGSANTVGLVAGYIDEGATVKLYDVTFKDCVVNGYQKEGGIVGQLHGTLEMTNVTFENVSVNGVVEVAKIAATVEGKGNLTVNSGCDFSGITTNAIKGDYPNTVKQSEISGFDFKTSSSDNVYVYGHPDTGTKIFAGATDDWAWYLISGDDTQRANVTVNGNNHSLAIRIYSASSNFSGGTPNNQ